MRADLEARIRSRGAELGFERIGFSSAGPSPRSDALRRWVAQGLAGGMAYMEQDVEGRANPTRRSPWARTVVSAALHYDPPAHVGPGGEPVSGMMGRISSYAVGRDYHDVLRSKLGDLARFIREEAGGRAEARALVDTSAILERDAGSLGSIGWTGKNAMLIDPGAGSYFFLGEVLTDIEIAPSGETEDLCGACTACIDACPTGAIVDARVVDARRCVSYLTIEHRGAIPEELRGAIGGHLFGCDVCQDVCPWNRRAVRGRCEDLAPAPAIAETTLEDAVRLDATGFGQRFRKTAMARTHREGLVRNALVVAANVGDGAALAAGTTLLEDPDPGVRETAVWALSHGDARERRLALRAAENEPDPEVRSRLRRSTGEPTS